MSELVYDVFYGTKQAFTVARLFKTTLQNEVGELPPLVLGAKFVLHLDYENDSDEIVLRMKEFNHA